MAKFHERYWILWEEARDRDHRVKRVEFAENMGVTAGQSNGWLDTGTEPDCNALLTIAKRADVSVSWLVGETNIRKLQIPALYYELPTKAADELTEFVKYLRHKYKLK